MLSEVIATYNSAPVIRLVTDAGLEIVKFTGDMDIDRDGSQATHPNSGPYYDKWYEAGTTLHRDGKPLDPYVDSWIVVPPVILQKTQGIVMGSLAMVENILRNLTALAVVGDEGPRDKIGEASPACAQQVGVNINPMTGGVSDRIIRYTIFVGVPARLGNVQYVLQPS